jgi:GWxTD domain-containing protein
VTRGAHRLRLAAAILAGLSLAFPSSGQTTGQNWFDQGMRSFEQGDYDGAAASFDSLLTGHPAWLDVQLGSGAYWLGESHMRSGRTADARSAWGRGLDSLYARSGFDVRLADAYLWSILLDKDGLESEMGRAVDLYVNLLYNVDAPLVSDEITRMSRHMAQFAVVAPAGVLSDAVRGDPLEGVDAWSPREGAGPLLVAWWRSQDPIPATRENERIQEHLRRVAHVSLSFSDPEDPTGVDERGTVYLRYGPPEEEIEVKFDDPILTDIIFRPGVSVSLSDFPDNEFWVFGHIDRAAWFLFVKSEGRFKIAETIDLIPRTLRSGFSSSTRGRVKAGMTIAVLQNIFRQLAPLHPDFAMRYAEVDAYAMQMPEFQAGRMVNRSAGRLGVAPGGILGGTQVDRPDQFAQNIMVKSRSEDDASIARREDYVPRIYTEALAGTGELAVGYRAIRYLEPDGSTRTVIHWSPEPGALRPGRAERRLLRSMSYEDTGKYLVTFTAVQKELDYQDRVVHRDRFLVTDLPKRNEAIPVQQTTLTGDTALFNVAMQWDQFAMGVSKTRRGPIIRVTTARLDSLPPLQADQRVLEMSDLLPMVAPVDAGAIEPRLAPYPFNVLSRDQQMGLSFEAYHLDYGIDDRTHYTISFDVTRNLRRGGILSFLGREQGTSASFSGSGTSRKVNEMILIDLRSWEGRGELDVTVHLTDDTNGRTVSRSLTFELR